LKKLILSLTILFVVLTCNIVWASALTNNTFDNIMSLSGLNKQIAEFPGLVQAGIEQAYHQNPSISSGELADLKGVVAKAFMSEKFLNTISDEIRKTISEEEGKQLLSWYESSTGRQITVAEENASTPEAYQAMIREAQFLFSDKNRIDLAQKVDTLVGISDMTLQIQMDTAVAVFMSASSALNKNQKINIDNFKNQLEAQKEQMRENIEKLTLLSFLYSYKNIEIDTLEEYINFISKPATMKFNESVVKGMKSAFNQATNEIAKSLGIMVSSQKI